MLLATLQPSIFPFGIRIDEPVTTITDLLVTAVCFYAFIKLNNIDSNLRIHKYLKYYFLSMSIATLFGGIVGHGFLYLFVASWDAPKTLIDFLTSFFSEELFRETANPWKLPGWLTSMVAVALLERATIEHASKTVNKKTEVFFKRLNVIELLTFMTITFLSLNFKFVEIHSAYGIMFVVGSFSLFNYIKTKSEASKTYLIAVVIVNRFFNNIPYKI